MEQQLLEQIRDLLDHKENLSIVLTSKSTSWTTTFSPPLYLDPKRKFEMALVDLETYYSIPNINETNNQFIYTDGKVKKRLTIPLGSYEITDIDSEIQRQLQLRGDADSAIKLSVNTATLRCVILIGNPAYKIDMRASTIRTVLGFNERELSVSYNEGDSVVNILSVNSIMITCNLIGGSYKDGVALPIIYSFFPDVSPGEKIIETPHNLVYLPMTSAGSIGQIEIRLLDQDGQPIELRGEQITIRLHLRSM